MGAAEGLKKGQGDDEKQPSKRSLSVYKESF